MGRHARERAREPQERKGSHPPPRRPHYSADATKRRYKERSDAAIQGTKGALRSPGSRLLARDDGDGDV